MTITNEFRGLHAAVKTSLPAGHTKAERIEELKAILTTDPTKLDFADYSYRYLINQLNRLDDEQYMSICSVRDKSHFCRKGLFGGSYKFKGRDQDMLSVIRDPGDMNWYLWEAILVDLDTASLLKLVPESVSVKARDINKETERAGHFSEPLRKLACEVEQCIEKFRKELDAHYAAEESKYMNQP